MNAGWGRFRLKQKGGGPTLFRASHKKGTPISIMHQKGGKTLGLITRATREIKKEVTKKPKPKQNQKIDHIYYLNG